MQGEKFGMSYDDCVRMTYRQVWERFVADALDESKEFEQTADSTPSPAKTKQGAFEAHKATEKEANSFFDQLCGGRVYDGPKWWIPGEVPGIEHYNG